MPNKRNNDVFRGGQKFQLGGLLSSSVDDESGVRTVSTDTSDFRMEDNQDVNTLHEVFSSVDKEIIHAVLDECGGNVSKATEKLLEICGEQERHIIGEQNDLATIACSLLSDESIPVNELQIHGTSDVLLTAQNEETADMNNLGQADVSTKTLPTNISIHTDLERFMQHPSATNSSAALLTMSVEPKLDNFRSASAMSSCPKKINTVQSSSSDFDMMQHVDGETKPLNNESFSSTFESHNVAPEQLRSASMMNTADCSLDSGIGSSLLSYKDNNGGDRKKVNNTHPESVPLSKTSVTRQVMPLDFIAAAPESKDLDYTVLQDPNMTQKGRKTKAEKNSKSLQLNMSERVKELEMAVEMSKISSFSPTSYPTSVTSPSTAANWDSFYEQLSFDSDDFDDMYMQGLNQFDSNTLIRENLCTSSQSSTPSMAASLDKPTVVTANQNVNVLQMGDNSVQKHPFVNCQPTSDPQKKQSRNMDKSLNRSTDSKSINLVKLQKNTGAPGHHASVSSIHPSSGKDGLVQNTSNVKVSNSELSPHAPVYIPRPLAILQSQPLVSNVKTTDSPVFPQPLKPPTAVTPGKKKRGKANKGGKNANAIQNDSHAPTHAFVQSTGCMDEEGQTNKDFDPLDPLGWNDVFSELATPLTDPKPQRMQRSRKSSGTHEVHQESQSKTQSTGTSDISVVPTPTGKKAQKFVVPSQKFKTSLPVTVTGHPVEEDKGIPVFPSQKVGQKKGLPSPASCPTMRISDNVPQTQTSFGGAISSRLPPSLSSKGSKTPVSVTESMNPAQTSSHKMSFPASMQKNPSAKPHLQKSQSMTSLTAQPQFARNQLTFHGVKTPVGVIRRYIQEKQPVMIILRGLPGSGKTHLARQLIAESQKEGVQGVILSTDDYFMKGGQYVYDRNELGNAHEWNKRRALQFVKQSRSPLIIDNTNTTLWELLPYAKVAVEHCYDLQLFEPDTPWRMKVVELMRKNCHGVPKESIKKMKDRYENLTTDIVLKEASKSLASRQSMTISPDHLSNKVSQPQPEEITKDFLNQSLKKAMVNILKGNDIVQNIMNNNIEEKPTVYADEELSPRSGVNKADSGIILSSDEETVNISSDQSSQGTVSPGNTDDTTDAPQRESEKNSPSDVSLPSLVDYSDSGDSEKDVTPRADSEDRTSRSTDSLCISSREQSPLVEKISQDINQSPKGNKKKRVRKGRNPGPFIEESLKLKTKTENWSSFMTQPAENSTTFPDDLSTSVTEAPRVELVSSSTQSEPYYFSIIHKLNSPAFNSLQPIDIESCDENVITSKVNSSEKLASTDGPTSIPTARRAGTIDRSTSTDENLEKEEIDLETLQSCFPEYSRKQLEYTMSVCHNNLEWVTNHLLDSPALFDMEDDDEEVDVEAYIEEESESVSASSVKSLADMCISVVEETNQIEREDLERQVIQAGQNRLERMESFGWSRLLSYSEETSGDKDDAIAVELISLEDFEGASVVQPQHTPDFKRRQAGHSPALTKSSPRGTFLTRLEEQHFALPSVTRDLTSSFDQLDIHHYYHPPSSDAWTSPLKQETSVMAPHLQQKPMESFMLDGKVVIPTELVRCLEHLYGALDLPVSKEGLVLDDQTSRKIHRSLKLLGEKKINHRDDEQLKNDEALAKALQEEEYRTAPQRNDSVQGSDVPGWTNQQPAWMAQGGSQSVPPGMEPGFRYGVGPGYYSDTGSPHIHSVSTTVHQLRGTSGSSLKPYKFQRQMPAARMGHDERWGKPRLGSAWAGVKRRGPTDSLQAIMEEEMAREEKQREQLRIIQSTGDTEALATRIKRNELAQMFPSMGPDLLEDIFLSTGYSLKETVNVIERTYNIQRVPVPKVREDAAMQFRDTGNYDPQMEPSDYYYYEPGQEQPEVRHLTYEKIREGAQFYRSLARDSYEQALRNHNIGFGDVALFYRCEARRFRQEEFAANQRAAEMLFDRGRERLHKENTLDLHFYHLDEAITVVNRAIQMKEEAYRYKPIKKNSYLNIVTGRGKNSKNGVPRLKPAIMNHLRDRCFRFEDKSPGMIRVYLGQRIGQQ